MIERLVIDMEPPMMSYHELITSTARADDGYLVLVLIAVACAFLLHRYNPRWIMSTPMYFELSITMVALLIRVPPLFQSFWYDETFSGNIARLSLIQAWSVIRSDVHPPLMYALQWLIANTLGSSEITLRLLPLLFGVLAIHATYNLGSLWNQRVATGAALLLAVSPPMLWYSVESRQYSLLLLIVLIAAKALKTHDKPLTAGALFILPWTHSYGFIYAGLLGLYGLKRGIGWRWLAGASLGAFAWLPIMIQQSRDVADGAFWIPSPTVGAVLKVLTDTTLGNGFPWELAIVLMLPTLAILLVAVWRTRDSLLLVLIIGVPVSAALISVLWSPIWLPRAMLPVGAALLLAVAIQFQRRAALVVMVAVLAVGSGFILSGYSARPAMRDYVAACESKPIYALTISNAIIARYYSSADVYVYPASANYDQWLSADALEALDLQVMDVPSLPTGWCLFVVDTPAMSAVQRLKASLLTEGRQQRLYSHPIMRVEIYHG